jgi:SAM-dependent methyltransferase
MGIALFTARLLHETALIAKFKGNILQLGKQDIQFSIDDLSDIMGVETITELENRKLSDISFFKSLGFDMIKSADYSKYEGADYLLDLNIPTIASSSSPPLAGFDVIFDGGTLEHIFNVPQALKNIFDLLSENGVIIHNVGSSNYVDHGFYSFSPTFFWDFYTQNGFEVLISYYYEFDPTDPRKCWIYRYTPGEIDYLSMGGWGSRPIAIWFVARKVKNSSATVIPQQGSYVRNEWNLGKRVPEQLQQRKSIIRSVLKRVLIYRFLVEMRHRLKIILFGKRPKPFKIYH